MSYRLGLAMRNKQHTIPLLHIFLADISHYCSKRHVKIRQKFESHLSISQPSDTRHWRAICNGYRNMEMCNGLVCLKDATLFLKLNAELRQYNCNNGCCIGCCMWGCAWGGGCVRSDNMGAGSVSRVWLSRDGVDVCIR